MNDPDYDLVIVGSGPAGMTAGMYAARSRLNVVLLERMAPGGQILITDWIENYPGFPDGISGPELTMKMSEHAQKFNLPTETAEVVSAELSDTVKTLHLSDGQTITCYSLIIASGASPRKLDLPQEEEYYGRGLSFCGTCDGPFFRDKVVAAVGGGDTAVQESIYLTKFVDKLYLIHRRDQLRAAAILRERAEENEKIEILWDTVVTGVEGEGKVENLRLLNVKTDQARDLPVDGLFVWIGILPNADYIGPEVQRDEYGFVITNADMETSVPGVFAAGDVRSTPLRQIATAVGDAAIAAYCAEHYIENIKK